MYDVTSAMTRRHGPRACGDDAPQQRAAAHGDMQPQMEPCGDATYVVHCPSGLDSDGVDSAARDVCQRLRRNGRELHAVHGARVVRATILSTVTRATNH